MRVTPSQRRKIKAMYGGKCAYCGDVLGDKWHVDHVKPLVRDFEMVKCQKTGAHVTRSNGECKNPENDTLFNLKPSCTPCNYNKKSLSLDAWRSQLAHYRDIQIIRDCPQIRHLLRFKQVEFKAINTPIIFYFEKFDLLADKHGFKPFDKVVLKENFSDIERVYIVMDMAHPKGSLNCKIYDFSDSWENSESWSFVFKASEIRTATPAEVKQRYRLKNEA